MGRFLSFPKTGIGINRTLTRIPFPSVSIRSGIQNTVHRVINIFIHRKAPHGGSHAVLSTRRRSDGDIGQKVHRDAFFYPRKYPHPYPQCPQSYRKVCIKKSTFRWMMLVHKLRAIGTRFRLGSMLMSCLSSENGPSRSFVTNPLYCEGHLHVIREMAIKFNTRYASARLATAFRSRPAVCPSHRR